jgi:hypothetical protein
LKDQGVLYIRELKSEEADSFSSENTTTPGASNSLFLKDIPDNIVYLVRPNLSLIKTIARQIKAYRSACKLILSILFVVCLIMLLL